MCVCVCVCYIKKKIRADPDRFYQYPVLRVALWENEGNSRPYVLWPLLACSWFLFSPSSPRLVTRLTVAQPPRLGRMCLKRIASSMYGCCWRAAGSTEMGLKFPQPKLVFEGQQRDCGKSHRAPVSHILYYISCRASHLSPAEKKTWRDEARA